MIETAPQSEKPEHSSQYLPPDFDLQQLKQQLPDLTEEETTKYILRSVCQGEAKCSIVDSKPLDAPINLEQLGLSEHDQRTAEMSIKALRGYLNLPIIIDGFRDHGDKHKRTGRRGFKEDMLDAFGPDFVMTYERNKLNGGKLANIETVARYIGEAVTNYPNLVKIHRLAEQLRKAIPSMKDYEKMDLNQRIARVYRVDLAGRTLIETLSRMTGVPRTVPSMEQIRTSSVKTP